MVLAILVMMLVTYLTLRGFSEPFMALLALLTVYITQPGELFPLLGYLHVERVLLIFVIISFVVNGRRLCFPTQTKAFFGFYAAMIVAVPLSFWVSNSVHACQSFIETAIIHLLIVALLLTEGQVKKFLIVWTGLTAWLGAGALYEYHAGVHQFAMGIERAEGLTSSGGDPNTLAITMVVGMPLCFLLMSKGNEKGVRIFGLISLGIELVTVINTGSRTAFLAFIFFLLMLLFQEKKNLKFLPVLIVAAPLFWLVIPQQYRTRYQSIETRNQDESYTNRILSWEGGKQMFLHNPLTGVGPGNYAYANGMRYWPGYPRHWLDAHSLYFKLIGELGSVGVLAFGSYVILLIQLNRRLSKQLKNLNYSIVIRKFPMYCNLSIFLLLFTGYSAHNLYRPTWFMLGAVSASIGLLKEATPSTSQEDAPKGKKLPLWIPTEEDSAPESLPATVQRFKV
jgi:O-antigen ligase